MGMTSWPSKDCIMEEEPLASVVKSGLNASGVSGNSCVTICASSVGVPSSESRGVMVILYAFASLESRTTIIGLGALPDRARLEILLIGGGAKRSEPADAKDDELCALAGEGSCKTSLRAQFEYDN